MVGTNAHRLRAILNGTNQILFGIVPGHGEKHVILAGDWVCIILHRSDQRLAVFAHEGKGIPEGIRAVRSHLPIFKAGNDPLFPALGSHSIRLHFHTSHVQSL